MFKKRWFQNVWVSSDGYIIEIPDRTSIRHRENGQKILVGAEMLAPRNTWAIWPEQMWIVGLRKKPLTDDNVREIVVSHIRDLFEHLDWKLEVA